MLMKIWDLEGKQSFFIFLFNKHRILDVWLVKKFIQLKLVTLKIGDDLNYLMLIKPSFQANNL